MLTLKELDSITKDYTIAVFKDKDNNYCIDCHSVIKDEVNIYMVKYYKDAHVHINMLFCLCNEHAARHPIKYLSRRIEKLNEKEIFYIRINNEKNIGQIT